MLNDLFANIPFTIIATGALVGVASSLLGTFLVLRGNSMLVDAIGHSIVFGIMIVWLLTHQQSGPLQVLGATLTGVLTVLLTETVAGTRRVKYDAAIGLVFPVLFSVGVLLLNLNARNVHIDQHTVLLGEIGFVWLDTVRIGGAQVPNALLWMSIMTMANLAFVTLLYKELKLATFDAALAKALGFAPVALSYALLTLTSATAVAAFDAVGAVLLIAFVIVPPTAAHLLTDRLWLTILYGALIAVVSSVLGYVVAVALDVSIGGMMALATGGFLLLAFLFGPHHGLIAQARTRANQGRSNASRALAVHLYHHEGGPAQAEENVVQALREHLRWDEAKARRTLLHSLDSNYVRRSGDTLLLTPKGRAVAQEVFEPWGGS